MGNVPDKASGTFERAREDFGPPLADEATCRELWMKLWRTAPIDDARVGDAFLVCAALANESRAVKIVRGRIDAAARRCGDVDADDIAQRCWIRLFSSQQRILRYAGRGDLDGLLRVATQRLALNAIRDADHDESLERVMSVEDPQTGPESNVVDAEYARAFKSGVERAIADLSEDERLLLKLHFVDALGIDKLAGVLGIHRATAARRLERARERVAKRVRALLQDSLGDAGVRDSHLLRLRSQLDMSLSRVLTTQENT